MSDGEERARALALKINAAIDEVENSGATKTLACLMVAAGACVATPMPRSTFLDVCGKIFDGHLQGLEELAKEGDADAKRILARRELPGKPDGSLN